jgi:flagellum-specific peptidoglycan hydrolase FlgJ
MIHKPFFSNFATFLLVNFIFASKHLNAQSGESDSTDNSVFKQWNDKVVDASARISTTYNADYYTVESFVWAALEYEAQIGIPATVVVGIAVYESSFTSYLFQHSGNPFGIKAGGDWTGPTFTKHDDGADTPFRMYISPEEAVLDFGAFIQARSWYNDARVCPRSDYRCVVEGLKKTDNEPGYSSNPEWDERLIEIIEKLGLQGLSAR